MGFRLHSTRQSGVCSYITRGVSRPQVGPRDHARSFLADPWNGARVPHSNQGSIFHRYRVSDLRVPTDSCCQVRTERMEPFSRILLFAAPIVILGSLCAYVNYEAVPSGPLAGAMGSQLKRAAHGGVDSVVVYVLGQLRRFYDINVGLGGGLVSYWGSISWLMTPVLFGSVSLTLFVFEFISVTSALVVILMMLRQIKVFARLAALARRRVSALTVLRLATGNLVLTTYFVFIAAMLAFSVFTNGEVVKQGRYWLPFILANFLCATIYASEVLPGRLRSAFSRTMLVALCVYSAIASGFAIHSMEARFYQPVLVRFPFERALHVDSSCADPGDEVQREATFAVERGQLLNLCGWALELSTGAPVEGVYVQVDKLPPKEARYGLPRPDVVQALLDERFLPSGFHLALSTEDLSQGAHRVRFLVKERHRGTIYAVMTIFLTVVG